MISNFLDKLFGCWHKRYSFPITVKTGQRRSGAASATGTYIVCLDCGKEFPYDWHAMKVVGGGAAVANSMSNVVESYAGK